MASIHPEIPLSPKKKLKLSSFNTTQQIQEMKDEIGGNITSLRDKLDAKECELYAEVDRLGALQVSEKEDLEQELDELQQGKNAFQKSDSYSTMKQIFNVAIGDLDHKINNAELKLRQFQEINSLWNLEQCESSINSLCLLSNVTNTESLYISKSVAKWGATLGKSSSELYSPISIAIQQSTDNVFVSDMDGHRIQVFNYLGKHIRMFDNFKGPLKVFHVDDSSIFAITSNNSENVNIIELCLDSSQARDIECPNTFSLISSDIITANLSSMGYVFYSCAFEISNFSHFRKFLGTDTLFVIQLLDNDKNDSSFPNPTLPSQQNSNIQFKELSMGKPVSITTDGKHVYILVIDFKHLILEFDPNCDFIRSFLPSSLLSEAKSVCVDGRGNLLVAGGEGDSTKVLCLSPDGNLIHELFLPHHNCVSVAVNSKFDVFILCDGDKYGLKIF